jgi:hypothetical protein
MPKFIRMNAVSYVVGRERHVAVNEPWFAPASRPGR